MTPQNRTQTLAHLAYLLADALEADSLGLEWAVLSHLERTRDIAAELADELLDELRQEMAAERATSSDS